MVETFASLYQKDCVIVVNIILFLLFMFDRKRRVNLKTASQNQHMLGNYTRNSGARAKLLKH